MTLFHKTNMGALFHADSLNFLKTIPDNSISSTICDPPYGLSKVTFKDGERKTSSAGFMNQQWDYDVPSVELWKEVYRVLKPGSTLIAFSGSRTMHRMAVNIEEAGFELKDCIQYLNQPDVSQFYDSLDSSQQQAFINLMGGNSTFWTYSTGMPKNLALDILIDKRLNVKRNVVGTKTKGSSPLAGNHKGEWTDGQCDGEFNVTEATSSLAKKWVGYHTVGMKPSYEPILIAMKPNDGTYVDNVIKHGIAGINTKDTKIGNDKAHEGRFPSNTMLSHGHGCTEELCTEECPVHILDKQFNSSPSKYFKKIPLDTKNPVIYIHKPSSAEKIEAFKDKYILKEELFKEGFPTKIIDKEQYDKLPDTTKKYFEEFKNRHPTQKPIALMEYLCLLTKTPSGGVVLDPFGGSCTTAVACINTGRPYLIIEREQKYCEIGKTRLEHAINKKNQNK